MRPKQTALQLATAGVAVISLLAGIAQPAMASTTAKITPLAATSSCPLTYNDYGHPGAMICNTTELRLPWASGAEDVVIGTTFKVYHDSGSGWSVLQNGSVLSSASTNKMGLEVPWIGVGNFGAFVGVTIAVLGTTGHYYCNTKKEFGNWQGWTTTKCPQQY